MNKWERFQYVMETSDWKMWVVSGIALIVIIYLLQEWVIDHRVKKARDAVMATIHHEQEMIENARKESEKQDKKIDAAFKHAMQSSEQVVDDAHQQMAALRQEIGMDKRK